MSTPLELISLDTTLEDAIRAMFDKKNKEVACGGEEPYNRLGQLNRHSEVSASYSEDSEDLRQRAERSKA